MVAQIDRLLATPTVELGGCWRATTKPDAQGYVRYGKQSGGKKLRTIGLHRAFYHKLRGPAPRDLDHLCRNRWCVNPWHLEDVPRRENILRGAGVCAANGRKLACPRCARPYDNITTNRRRCRACTRDARRVWEARRALEENP